MKGGKGESVKKALRGAFADSIKAADRSFLYGFEKEFAQSQREKGALQSWDFGGGMKVRVDRFLFLWYAYRQRVSLY